VILHDTAADLARKVLYLQQARTTHLPPSVLNDHAWSLLLSMFIADTAGEQVTAYNVFARANVPPLLGARWMSVLMSEGLSVSEGAGNGSAIVGLTPHGISAIEGCMAEATALLIAEQRPPAG
jgi:hypothetical protein